MKTMIDEPFEFNAFLDSRGRVNIDKNIRSAFDLKRGDTLYFELKGFRKKEDLVVHNA